MAALQSHQHAPGGQRPLELHPRVGLEVIVPLLICDSLCSVAFVGEEENDDAGQQHHHGYHRGEEHGATHRSVGQPEQKAPHHPLLHPLPPWTGNPHIK